MIQWWTAAAAVADRLFPSIETCFRWRRRRWRTVGPAGCCRSRWWRSVRIHRRIGRLNFIALCRQHSQWIDSRHVHVLRGTRRRRKKVHFAMLHDRVFSRRLLFKNKASATVIE